MANVGDCGGAPDLTMPALGILTNETGERLPLAEAIRAAMNMEGGFGDCRLDDGVEDWNYQPNMERCRQVLEMSDDQLHAQFAKVRRLRPHRCKVCGFRWKTEDESSRCCREGGMKWCQTDGFIGCLSTQEREACRVLFRQGRYPKEVGRIKGFNDEEYQHSQTVFGRWRAAILRSQHIDHAGFHQWMKDQRVGDNTN